MSSAPTGTSCNLGSSVHASISEKRPPTLFTRVMELLGNMITVAVIRVFQLLVCVSMDSLVPDHVPSGVLGFTCRTGDPTNDMICRTINPFTHWDGAHFLQISRARYESEQSLVFFPLFPGLLHSVGSALQQGIAAQTPPGVVVSLETCLVLAGLIINVCCSAIAAQLLVMYCHKAFGFTGQQQSRLRNLFCFSPASIFYLACYSEPLYTTCLLGGLVAMEWGFPILTCACFLLASTSRANGIFNCVLVALLLGQKCYARCNEVFEADVAGSSLGNTSAKGSMTIREEVARAAAVLSGTSAGVAGLALSAERRKPAVALSTTASVSTAAPLPKFRTAAQVAWVCSLFAVYACACLLCVLLPYVVMTVKGVWTICSGVRLDPLSAHPRDVMCQSLLPNTYGYLQQKYWNVGFLRFYEWRQLPNFLIGLPCLLLCAFLLWQYALCNSAPNRLLLMATAADNVADPSTGSVSISQLKPITWKQIVHYVATDRLLPHLVHLVLVLAICVCFAHVQVTTRIVFSSCPVVSALVAVQMDLEQSRVCEKRGPVAVSKEAVGATHAESTGVSTNAPATKSEPIDSGATYSTGENPADSAMLPADTATEVAANAPDDKVTTNATPGTSVPELLPPDPSDTVASPGSDDCDSETGVPSVDGESAETPPGESCIDVSRQSGTSSSDAVVAGATMGSQPGPSVPPDAESGEPAVEHVVDTDVAKTDDAAGAVEAGMAEVKATAPDPEADPDPASPMIGPTIVCKKVADPFIPMEQSADKAPSVASETDTADIVAPPVAYSQYIAVYFGLYCLAGFVLFPNNFPWT